MTEPSLNEMMDSRGKNVPSATPELVKGVQERAKGIEDKWVKDATAKGVDGAAVLAAFRAEVKRVAAGN